jgi:hypothetical protein
VLHTIPIRFGPETKRLRRNRRPSSGVLRPRLNRREPRPARTSRTDGGPYWIRTNDQAIMSRQEYISQATNRAELHSLCPSGRRRLHRRTDPEDTAAPRGAVVPHLCAQAPVVEEVLIDLLDLVPGSGAYAEVELDHQVRQLLAVHQRDAASLIRRPHCLPRERAGGDEHNHGRLPDDQCTCQAAYHISADSPLGSETVRRDVDVVETQPVLHDDAVDAAITTSSYRLPGIIERPSVSHAYEQPNHHMLKERRRLRPELLQQLLREVRFSSRTS